VTYSSQHIVNVIIKIVFYSAHSSYNVICQLSTIAGWLTRSYWIHFCIFLVHIKLCFIFYTYVRKKQMNSTIGSSLTDPTFLCLSCWLLLLFWCYSTYLKVNTLKSWFHWLSDFACYNPSRRVLKSDFPLAWHLFCFLLALLCLISDQLGIL
jgi:hypothetical protein